MISDIEDRLRHLGLKKSPFLNYRPDNPDFLRIFIDRTKELSRMNLALEYYASHSNRNIACIGPPRIGKTTLLLYTLQRIREQFRCQYLECPPRFDEFCKKGIIFFASDNETEISRTEGRELGNLFIERSGTDPDNAILFIDNFEEMLALPQDEVDEFIRIFRRAKCLFVIACTEQEWAMLLSVYPKMKYAFAEEIFIPPFSLKSCMEFFEARMVVARDQERTGIQPFTPDAARIIGIYAFFVPGRINDLANRVLFEALTEEIASITPEFVRDLVYRSPVTGNRFEGLNEKEISTLEMMIEKNTPLTFEDLSGYLGVSRVAAAGYIQTLADRGIVTQLDSPGKKKYFRITEEFKAVLV
ncbi:MAG: hypothetical protein KA091_02345 [Methanoregulaceae archaeon]|jgi:predicted AAA+ superfamily ATPase|nr:hypothetical protein [Methanoregulaceae archaeon]